MSDFARYLSSKRSVDDRALNRRVWERLRSEIAAGGGDRVLRVVDVGAGIASAAERMRDWELVAPSMKVQVRYTAVEPRDELFAALRRRLRSLPFEVDHYQGTLEAFAGEPGNRERFDLVLAQALVDILDLSSSLDALVRLTHPGGLVYLPITFDGETVFEPARQEDAHVLSAYHGTMTGPQAGRRLFHALRRYPVEVLEFGSSDWVVHPVGTGYPEDEAFFLRFILKTIEGAVAGLVDPELLDRWIAARSSQIDRGELVYIAHQLDILGRKRKR